MRPRNPARREFIIVTDIGRGIAPAMLELDRQTQPELLDFKR